MKQEHVWDVQHPLAGIDHYTRATLNAVSRVKTMAEPWRLSSMTSIFNTSWENPKMHIWCEFGDSSSNPNKSKLPKWPWMSRSLTSVFNTSQEYSRMHVWCKFGDYILNLRRFIMRTSRISRILSQNNQNDVVGHGQWPPFLIPAESIPRCMFGANLMVLAQTYDELSCGQAECPRN